MVWCSFPNTIWRLSDLPTARDTEEPIYISFSGFWFCLRSVCKYWQCIKGQLCCCKCVLAGGRWMSSSLQHYVTSTLRAAGYTHTGPSDSKYIKITPIWIVIWNINYLYASLIPYLLHLYCAYCITYCTRDTFSWSLYGQINADRLTCWLYRTLFPAYYTAILTK